MHTQGSSYQWWVKHWGSLSRDPTYRPPLYNNVETYDGGKDLPFGRCWPYQMLVEVFWHESDTQLRNTNEAHAHIYQYITTYSRVSCFLKWSQIWEFIRCTYARRIKIEMLFVFTCAVVEASNQNDGQESDTSDPRHDGGARTKSSDCSTGREKARQLYTCADGPPPLQFSGVGPVLTSLKWSGGKEIIHQLCMDSSIKWWWTRR